MLFSSLLFLTVFLPFTLVTYFLLDRKFKNLFLLVMSLFFYSWGEPRLFFVMIVSIMINYVAGLLIHQARSKGSLTLTKLVLALAITVNLALLVYYKYFNFLVENLQSIGLFGQFNNENILLPVGISFFTFHSISYLVDLYRGEAMVQRNAFNLGLYISFFPQLIAGPIIRYHDVDKQIAERTVTGEQFTEGIARFIRGLGKKVLIANNVALIADKIFDIPAGDLPALVSWIGIISYTLQIYFDFSGYSDMAIGLGKMFGINFLENFNYPYISKSIQEFWRRWHISLSSWFRDYLYIPLGGNRKGEFITYRNLLIVFFLTGLWHGATWSFVVWGLFHGAFLTIERLGFAKLLAKLPAFVQVTYTLLVVIIGWVFFRSVDLTYAIGYLGSMFGFANGSNYSPLIYFNTYVGAMFIAGIVFSSPLRAIMAGRLWNVAVKTTATRISFKSLGQAYYLLILLICLIELAQSSYNPFIYFRF